MLKRTGGEYQRSRASLFTRGAHVQWFGFNSRRELVQMSLLGLVTLIGSTTEHALGYLELHHWFFGFIVIGYIFHLHDKSLHARFDALGKRIDEVRRRLACND